MAVTLSEAKKNVQDALTMGVIDEFRKNNFLLENLTFDDAVSPTGGGATLTYGYTRLITQPTAQFRAVNEEYTPQEVTKQRYTVDLKIFGGTFQLDRIIAGMGGIADEVNLQMTQKIKAAQALFNDTVINGDSAVDAKAFDGLDKALTGSSTEYIPSAAIDLSSSSAIDTNYKVFLDQLDEFLMGLDGEPSAIMGNLKLIAKIRACARRAGAYTITRDEFGKQVEKYNEIPLVDLGAKAGTNDPVVGTNANGETSIYVPRLGLDGFHGVSMAGHPPVRTWLPDFTTSGAVKTGEVEMVAAVALKATKAAGVMRKIKVQ
ncbi:phage capsid protein [Paenibacillus thiaminolyticus]|uniref:major capsid protein n=1 Tax=Paenibacillus thiaminolyticus TaxID=49283 RepID=UPI001161FF01|nr:phage capsid protein [Paenibacillus thiaminolyticus]NGP62697.1 phage capsid protein [Paenibacillus thiaminolyticus]NGP62750.1 phage capsid protein [Paenibacillus thiaminolyticus]